MSLREAAGTAIGILLGDLEGRWVSEGQSWQEYLFAEYDAESFEDLADNGSAWREAKYESSEETFENLTAKVVSEYGGEGQGDQYWMVISLSDAQSTRYFRKDGYYASYGDGGNLDGSIYEVKPAERLVTFYE
jgi:hypothetical protein